MSIKNICSSCENFFKNNDAHFKTNGNYCPDCCRKTEYTTRARKYYREMQKYLKEWKQLSEFLPTGKRNRIEKILKQLGMAEDNFNTSLQALTPWGTTIEDIAKGEKIQFHDKQELTNKK